MSTDGGHKLAKSSLRSLWMPPNAFIEVKFSDILFLFTSQWSRTSPTPLTNINPPPVNVVYGCLLIRLMMMTWKLNKRTKGLNILKTRNPWWLDLDTFKNQKLTSNLLKMGKFYISLLWFRVVLAFNGPICIAQSCSFSAYAPIFIFSH